jgi:hypothetical protein
LPPSIATRSASAPLVTSADRTIVQLSRSWVRSRTAAFSSFTAGCSLANIDQLDRTPRRLPPTADAIRSAIWPPIRRFFGRLWMVNSTSRHFARSVSITFRCSLSSASPSWASGSLTTAGSSLTLSASLAFGFVFVPPTAHPLYCTRLTFLRTFTRSESPAFRRPPPSPSSPSAAGSPA